MFIGRLSLALRCLAAAAACWPVGILEAEEQKGDSAKGQAAKTVTLTVDYGDGAQKRFTDIPWKEGMTVDDANRVAEKHARGVKLEIRGKDETALLLRIDDLRNAGKSGKNWVYRVNDKLGDRGFAVFPLQAGDAVLWRFEEYP